MPRPRHTELTILGTELTESIAEVDRLREVERMAETAAKNARGAGKAAKVQALADAHAAWVEASKGLRKCLGVYLAADLDMDSTRKLWRTMTDIAPGLALDQQDLDARRAEWAASGWGRAKPRGAQSLAARRR